MDGLRSSITPSSTTTTWSHAHRTPTRTSTRTATAAAWGSMGATDADECERLRVVVRRFVLGWGVAATERSEAAGGGQHANGMAWPHRAMEMDGASRWRWRLAIRLVVNASRSRTIVLLYCPAGPPSDAYEEAALPLAKRRYRRLRVLRYRRATTVRVALLAIWTFSRRLILLCLHGVCQSVCSGEVLQL